MRAGWPARPIVTLTLRVVVPAVLCKQRDRLHVPATQKLCSTGGQTYSARQEASGSGTCMRHDASQCSSCHGRGGKLASRSAPSTSRPDICCSSGALARCRCCCTSSSSPPAAASLAADSARYSSLLKGGGHHLLPSAIIRWLQLGTAISSTLPAEQFTKPGQRHRLQPPHSPLPAPELLRLPRQLAVPQSGRHPGHAPSPTPAATPAAASSAAGAVLPAATAASLSQQVCQVVRGVQLLQLVGSDVGLVLVNCSSGGRKAGAGSVFCSNLCTHCWRHGESYARNTHAKHKQQG